jgi:GT2 family glycosyltransferase
MMRRAVGELVLSIDDDSYPEQKNCLTTISTLFKQRPKLAVAHFPQRTDEYPHTLTQKYFGEAQATRAFANSGACFRRSTYQQLAGFEPRFYHMYEEPDYALQCTAAGHEIYFTPVIIIRHHWSGQARNELRVHHQHARNELWSAALRCPMPFVFSFIIWKVFSQLRFAFKRGPAWMMREPVWWGKAMYGLPYILRRRKPVGWAGFKQWLQLEDKQWKDATVADPAFWKSRCPAKTTAN